MKQWKRLAALSSAIVMAAATLTYFPSDTLQNIRWEISASAETTTEPQDCLLSIPAVQSSFLHLLKVPTGYFAGCRLGNTSALPPP